MKLLIGIVIIVTIILITLILIKKHSQNNNHQTQTNNNSEFYRYYSAINQMDYKQLEKIHNDLVPLCTYSLISGLVYYDDSIPYEKKGQVKNRIQQQIGDTIPENERIYGCVTYQDAKKLNQAIVKRLDELDKG